MAMRNVGHKTPTLAPHIRLKMKEKIMQLRYGRISVI